MRFDWRVWAVTLVGVGLTYVFDLPLAVWGMLAGVAATVIVVVRGEPSFGMGVAWLALGLVFLALAFYFSAHYGVSFEGLVSLKPTKKFARIVPFCAYGFMTMGMLLLAYRGLGKLGERIE